MTLLFAAVLATLVTAVYVRYRLGAVQHDWRQWHQNLPAEAQGEFDEARARMIVERAMADDSLLGAEAARTAGDWAEACRLLDLGAWVASQALPGRLAHLRAMGAAVRMAAAIAPPPALPFHHFVSREVDAVSSIGTIAHHILVSPAERFVLRLWVLACAFRLALRVMRRSSAALRAHPGLADAWDRYVSGHLDWKTADEEHLAAFRLLLQSAAAADRAESLAR